MRQCRIMLRSILIERLLLFCDCSLLEGKEIAFREGVGEAINFSKGNTHEASGQPRNISATCS